MDFSLLVLIVACVTATASLLGVRLAGWGISPTLILAIAGVLSAQFLDLDLSEPLASSTMERVVEMVLALLLFVDATEVKGGLLGHSRSGALRLLFIALPLSLVCAVALGYLLFPAAPLAVLVLIACAVMPIDLSASGRLFANRRIPRPVARLLNVESGYNDGVVAPVFVGALVFVDASDTAGDLGDAVLEALYSAAAALGVGGVLGMVVAVFANRALKRQWAVHREVGIAVVMTALMSYGVAVELNANGFVAAFVCGIAYRHFRADRDLGAAELEFVEDVALLCNIVLWFAVGLLIDYLFSFGLPDLFAVLFVLAVVSVLRIAPVLLSLIGYPGEFRDKAIIGVLGPRGTASIVFALLAWTKLPDDRVEDASLILFVTVWTVALSQILHSLASVGLAVRDARSAGEGRKLKSSGGHGPA